jgi:4-hydroxy-3-methylbut-2-en-1-yl diphosphate synthase IspG/GcpE
MERLDFTDFKVSIKSTNVPYTIAANRLLSERSRTRCTSASPRRARSGRAR